MYEKNGKKFLDPGDKIKVGSLTTAISEIIHQEYFAHDDFGNPDCWIVEFKDKYGKMILSISFRFLLRE